ncbi:hypothetical protein MTsPCn9_03100 [Croceitalea sp. MTPC9]|uniref:hypothetical protein n=1 Tax=unclassified Croceitalea TaxID=2632280 RepID=UPI002B3E6205|nr:hypothetical protein MTsPCn6_05610 [Croceitalea sp. MTPC6]GMN15374.1 hypothetical protein MTsPCn9_03100 [Croceitalea sp. MTPC9]
MGFDKYDDAKLVKTAKSLKTIVIAFGIIWLVIITILIGTQIYAMKKDSFNIAMIVPILVGPITMLPIYINYQNFKKEIERRGL